MSDLNSAFLPSGMTDEDDDDDGRKDVETKGEGKKPASLVATCIDGVAFVRKVYDRRHANTSR